MKRFDPSKWLLFIHILYVSSRAMQIYLPLPLLPFCENRCCRSKMVTAARLFSRKSIANDMMDILFQCMTTFGTHCARKSLIHCQLSWFERREHRARCVCQNMKFTRPEHISCTMCPVPVYCALKSISSSAKMWCWCGFEHFRIHRVDDVSIDKLPF